MRGQVQAVCFHPNKPFFFVASQKHVRVYHLMKQVMVKKLMSGAKWISSIGIHPTGDHLLIDSKLEAKVGRIVVGVQVPEAELSEWIDNNSVVYELDED